MFRLETVSEKRIGIRFKVVLVVLQLKFNFAINYDFKIGNYDINLISNTLALSKFPCAIVVLRYINVSWYLET